MAAACHVSQGKDSSAIGVRLCPIERCAGQAPIDQSSLKSTLPDIRRPDDPKQFLGKCLELGIGLGQGAQQVNTRVRVFLDSGNFELLQMPILDVLPDYPVG
jgi:hypothetical protein